MDALNDGIGLRVAGSGDLGFDSVVILNHLLELTHELCSLVEDDSLWPCSTPEMVNQQQPANTGLNTKTKAALDRARHKWTRVNSLINQL